MPNEHAFPRDIAPFVAKSRWTEADASHIVAAWRASKLSARAFANVHGIDHQRLSRWAKQLSSVPVLTEVFIVDEPRRANAVLIIELGQVRVLVDPDVDEEHLARVLRVVGSVC